MMNSSKPNSKTKMIAMIYAICFVVYNVVVFVIAGFEDHGASFWISYAFMIVAFAMLALTLFTLKNRSVQPKDWIFGFPILKHSAIYIVAEFIISVLFMLLDLADCPWWVALVVQIIVLAIHAVLVISCFMVQDTVMQVQTKVKTATFFIKMLQVDVEMLSEKATDSTVKTAFAKLAEQVRYSDPMSSEALYAIENQIKLTVDNADRCIAANDVNGALQLCDKATLLLLERNKRCRALK